MRLDNYLVENRYFPSRNKAQIAIKNGEVKVNNITIKQCSFDVSNEDIEIKESNFKYVSRSGNKLEEALNKFSINLENKIVLDIGASTGGFTDCCLNHGARKVYAFDVGHDQLNIKLRNDNRVVAKEGINCRYLTKQEFKDDIDFICMDVSFISCTKMFNAISNILDNNKECVILFKPQFEVGNSFINRQGIVTNDKIVMDKMTQAIDLATSYHLKFLNFIISPIKGTDGNKEYLLHFIKSI